MACYVRNPIIKLFNGAVKSTESDSATPTITIDGTHLANTESFKYIGSMVRRGKTPYLESGKLNSTSLQKCRQLNRVQINKDWLGYFISAPHGDKRIQ